MYNSAAKLSFPTEYFRAESEQSTAVYCDTHTKSKNMLNISRGKAHYHTDAHGP